MTEYKLYAMRISPQSVEFASVARFSRITSDYILIYSESAVPNAVALKDEDATRLSVQDTRWLLDCNIAIVGEEIARQKPTIIQNISKRLEELEESLKQEQEKIERGEKADE